MLLFGHDRYPFLVCTPTYPLFPLSLFLVEPMTTSDLKACMADCLILFYLCDVCRGYADVITLLLEHRADPNIVNSKGHTPIVTAVGRGHAGAVAVLAKHKKTNLCAWVCQPSLSLLLIN